MNYQQSNLNNHNYLQYLISEIAKVNAKVDCYADWLLRYTKKDETLLELINSFPKFVVIPPPEERENGALAGTLFEEDQVGFVDLEKASADDPFVPGVVHTETDQVGVADLEDVDDISGSSYFEVNEPIQGLDTIDPLFVKPTNVKEEYSDNSERNHLQLEVGEPEHAPKNGDSVRQGEGINLNTNTKKRKAAKGTISKKQFKCTICDKHFNCNSHLISHIRVHTGEKPFHCSACGIRFSRKTHLQQHFLIHTGEKPFECSICKRRFNRKSLLDNHFRIHTGEKPFRCSVCGNRFNQKQDLERHFRIHTGEKPFRCRVCGNCFGQKAHLNRHFFIHTGEKPFECSICKTRFRQRSLLDNHFRIHAGEKPFCCKTCGELFRLKTSLTKHQNRKCNWAALAGAVSESEDQVRTGHDDCGSSSVEVDEPGVGCEEDDKTSDSGPKSEFSGSEDIEPMFEVECLDNIDGISIPVNAKLTKVKENSDNSRRNNELEQEETINEPKIGYSRQPDSTANLLSLMKPCFVTLAKINMLEDDKIQSGTSPQRQGTNSNSKATNKKKQSPKAAIYNKKFKCETCNKHFRGKRDLFNHIRVHTGEKPFRCSVCGNRFSQKASLKVHFRIHNGENPFKCSVCTNHFRTNSDLVRHFRIHSGEMPFQCSVCKKRFKFSCSVNSHFRRVHKGERPFPCETCGKRFNQKSSLVYHKRNCN